jgi:hypothetical protein
MQIRFRVVLPIVLSSCSLLLFAWEHENNRVIESMGMAWDTGPPKWPYEAVPLFWYALNAPAYTACWPVVSLISKQTNVWSEWIEYAICLPAIAALWWWVGARIDYGLIGRRDCSQPKLVAFLLIAGVLALLVLAGRIGLSEYRSFQLYWPNHSPIYAILLLRAIGPILWCLVFAYASIRSAIRLRRRILSTSPD